MGLYDSIYFKRSMPEGFPPEITSETEFQTKSLDCEMLTFEIHEGGALKLVGGWHLEMNDPDPANERFRERARQYLFYDGSVDIYASFQRGGKRWTFDVTLHYWDGELKRIKTREPYCFDDYLAAYRAAQESASHAPQTS